ncbi:MAG: dependent oxidoreductase [Proteobacteria bacterium]|nr:dependent oxidoreductase [Pseudomonadota bacterium]
MPTDVVIIGGAFAEPAAAIDDGPLGPIIRTDADKQTTVPGLYAAGTSVHRALVFG